MLGAGALLLVVEAPPRRGPESVRAGRASCVRAASVRAVELAPKRHQVAAVRAGRLALDDPARATPARSSALDTLVTTLAELRAVDAFRPERGASSDSTRPPPRSRSAPRIARSCCGSARRNASGGSVSRRASGHPRIFLVGTGLLSALERVFYQADQLARTQ